MKYNINGIEHVFNMTLEADELVAPVEKEMFNAMPESFTVVASYYQSLVEMKMPKTNDEWEKIKEMITKGTVGIGYNLAMVNHFLREKKYMRKLLAILLVPEGKEFSEADLPEREKFMARYATKEIASEVVNYFFMRSGGSVNSLPQSSPKGTK